jgi:restriction endonuclease S subunit
MISQDNFIALLESLGFAKNKFIYSKTIGATSLSVDVTKQTIHYPESDGLVVNERQTCNFSANENFVVFECVHRLLDKGYKPEHIELEPKWKLGRGASGGRADILVKNNFGKPLLIIECKTAGAEFKKAWNKTQQDGDQLFSYAQQISETQFLCLYASDFSYTHNQPNRPANTITDSASGASAGFVNFWREEIFASDCSTVRGADDEHTEFLFNILKCRQDEIQSHAKGAAQPHMYPKDIAPMLVPKADPATQTNAVKEWRAIETETDNAKNKIANSMEKIDSLVESIYASTSLRIEITKLSTNIQYGLNEKMNEAGIGYKIFRMNEIIQGRMVDNGAMKCADISAEEFAKYRLNKGDLLFIRSNGSLEHIGKVGLFDLDGEYCYASYLVRIVPDLSKALPQYLACIMNSPTFRKGMVQLTVKSGGTNNINATKMKNIRVPVPSLAEQKKFVAKVEALEKQIADAQAVINGAPARKEAVMKKYL